MSLCDRPGEFFVHYWYFPDSYDNWMPADVAPENLEPDHKPIGPWKVYVRYEHIPLLSLPIACFRKMVDRFPEVQ